MKNNSLFQLYTDQDKVPTYKGMKCYFNVPFVGTFHEKQGFYYVIFQDNFGNFRVCQHDEEFFSCMGGGSIGAGWGDAYQADEYYFESESDFLSAMSQFNIDELDRDDILKLLKKIKKLKGK